MSRTHSARPEMPAPGKSTKRRPYRHRQRPTASASHPHRPSLASRGEPLRSATDFIADLGHLLQEGLPASTVQYVEYVCAGCDGTVTGTAPPAAAEPSPECAHRARKARLKAKSRSRGRDAEATAREMREMRDRSPERLAASTLILDAVLKDLSDDSAPYTPSEEGAPTRARPSKANRNWQSRRKQ